MSFIVKFVWSYVKYPFSGTCFSSSTAQPPYGFCNRCATAPQKMNEPIPRLPLEYAFSLTISLNDLKQNNYVEKALQRYDLPQELSTFLYSVRPVKIEHPSEDQTMELLFVACDKCKNTAPNVFTQRIVRSQ
jgi:hypothetical protein